MSLSQNNYGLQFDFPCIYLFIHARFFFIHKLFYKYFVSVCGICVCTYVCSGMPAYACMEARGWYCVSCCITTLLLWNRVSSLNLVPGWQPASPSDPISAPHCTALGVSMASLSSGCWGFELSSSCLHSKCSYPLEPSPQPLYCSTLLHGTCVQIYCFWVSLPRFPCQWTLDCFTIKYYSEFLFLFSTLLASFQLG